ncbi:SIR2 family protein [Streptococcus salivarius]|jgi:hypothetical protein|uniref:SIR2 family protein n=1 Tax=Streptococcus salivarius TaxID=1304 RepID=UPI0012BB55A4|nr:SIR2 family protein [Streptococcus salivarius]
MHEIDINLEFEEIFSDIKKRYLSTTNFPKFIIGTGLSITFEIPGMSRLADELTVNFSKHENSKYRDAWKKCESIVKKSGLEAALLTVPTDNDFVEKIREITGKFILEADYKVRENILRNKSAFEELLGYLIRSVSVNKKIIDVMTPNYDLIIETVADKLDLITTLGFKGNLFQTFDQEILKNPNNYFNNNNTILRVFKPHGSINWINREGNIYQTNDYSYLEKNSNDIEVVAPGSMKFQYGMTHDLLRQHREIFNSVYTDSMSNHSIFIYGYGFNDQQFDTVFENTKKDVIVLSMEIKRDIIDRARSNKNWTVFYKQIAEEGVVDGDYSFMIYKGEQYKLNSQLWDLRNFVEVFIG